MKIHDRTYTAATNACLLVGVASAFGFDKTHHVAWIAAGSCAGAVAIAMYFIRHWQRARGGEPVHEVSPRVDEMRTLDWETSRTPSSVSGAYFSLEQQVLANFESDLTERSLTEIILKQLHRSVLERGRVGKAKPGIHHYTTGMLIAMRTNEPRVYELAIAPKSTGRIKHVRTGYELATVTRSHKTVHWRATSKSARPSKHSPAGVSLFAEDGDKQAGVEVLGVRMAG